MKVNKIKFSDIVGMLERDEMKEILGGSGYGSGDYTYNGGSLNTVNVGGGGGSSSSSFNSFYNSWVSSYNSSINNSDTTTSSYSNSNNNYGGSGGGGSSGSFQQTFSHSLPMTNLPIGNGKNTQVGGLCLFRNMEVVEKYFGKSLNQSVFVMQYWHKHPTENVSLTGFQGNTVELTEFINESFNTTACTTKTAMITAINSNQPILAFLINNKLPNGTIDGHEVTIIEYKESIDSFKYYDSSTDKYSWKSFSYFTGCQAVISPKK